MNMPDLEQLGKDIAPDLKLVQEIKNAAGGMGLDGIINFGAQKGFSIAIDEAQMWIDRYNWPYDALVSFISGVDCWHSNDEPLVLPKISYNIVCTGRCGSKFLSDLLTINGYGAPKEYFGIPMISLFRNHRDYGLSSYRLLETLTCRAAQNGIFGNKIISEWYWPIATLMNRQDEQAFHHFIWSKPTIYLRRQSKVCHAISDFFAWSAKTWHVADPVAHTDFRNCVNAIIFDFDKINVHYSKVLNDEIKLRSFVSRLPNVLGVYYEELSERPDQVLKEIIEFATKQRPPDLMLNSQFMRTHLEKNDEFCVRFICEIRQRGLYGDLREDPLLSEIAHV